LCATLILPEGLAGSEESLTWLAKESRESQCHLMAQYYPTHHAAKYAALSRDHRAEYLK